MASLLTIYIKKFSQLCNIFMLFRISFDRSCFVPASIWPVFQVGCRGRTRTVLRNPRRIRMEIGDDLGPHSTSFDIAELT